MPAQAKTISLLKRLLGEAGLECRLIKLHGGRYQEAGLPDLMILSNDHTVPKFWLEIKRDWRDKPTALQAWNIEDLRKRGFITGYLVGDEFKANWDNEPVKFLDFLRTIQNS